MTSKRSAKHSLRIETNEAHRGREVLRSGAVTLETRHLKRMRVSVTASKLIFHSGRLQPPLSKLTESSSYNMRLGIEMAMDDL